MGDGELLSVIKVWAEQECRKQGLEQSYLNLVDKRLSDMRTRLENVIGKSNMDYIDKAITITTQMIRKDALKDKNDGDSDYHLLRGR